MNNYPLNKTDTIHDSRVTPIAVIWTIAELNQADQTLTPSIKELIEANDQEVGRSNTNWDHWSSSEGTGIKGAELFRNTPIPEIHNKMKAFTHNLVNATNLKLDSKFDQLKKMMFLVDLTFNILNHKYSRLSYVTFEVVRWLKSFFLACFS